MDRFEPNLRIPGPTGLPPSVREAGARQMINHRGPEFAAMLGRILAGMKPYFGTTSDIAIITTAGTGGLEAAVVNVLSPGDRVLAVSIGSFGDRFAKIARTYGADVTKIDVEWGQAADPAVLRAELERAGDYKAVLLTHNETSTGVMNPIPELAAVVREVAPEALILVDSVSGLGAVPFEMDAWGVDVVVTGSQKAWMAAPGLAMIAASERAWAAMETATMPRVYLDLRAHRDSHALGPDAVHAGHRRRLPGRRGPPADGRRGCCQRLRPPRGLRRGDPRRPARARLRALRRPAPRIADGDRGGRPRRPRLEGVQRRDQAPWPRPGRRPGQADRQDLPARPSRLGHARGDPRRDEHARDRLDRRRSPGPPGAAVAAAQVAALESFGVAAPAPAGAGA